MGADTELAIWGIVLYDSFDGIGPGCNRCGNSAYAASNMLEPDADGDESVVAVALWGTRRPSWLAHMTKGAEVSARWLSRWRRRGHTLSQDVLKARALGVDGVTERECWLPSTVASMVRMRSTGLLDTTGDRMRPRRGGAEVKPELDGVATA